MFSIEEEKSNSNWERIYVLRFCFDNLNIRISCNSNLEDSHLKNNMASIRSKKREAGKLNKKRLTLVKKK